VDPTSLHLSEAAHITRTGDIWLFRGDSFADRTIRAATNSPVNHVGMAIAIDDLPPLMWHAELGRSLPDAWTGKHHRGVQLHDLADAVRVWSTKYGQRAYLRQLDAEITPEMEDAVLRVVARLNGTPFPTTVGLARSWLTGKLRRQGSMESLYCASLVAITYEAMGLMPAGRPHNAFDPGSFWSGDELTLSNCATLSKEIPVLLDEG
jgi:hypothetical protein